MHITALQETRWTGKTTFRSGGFSYFASCNSRHHTFGVAFAVESKWSHTVIGFRAISERLCVLRIKGRFFNYSLINAHAPTDDKPEEEKDAFYDQLDDAYDQCPNHDIKLLVGDFNSKIGKETAYKPTIGNYSLHDETNGNGLRLVSFAAAHQMVVSSTCFPHKDIHKATWMSPDGHTLNQIDHVLIDGRHYSDVLDVRARRGPNIDSDHYLVMAKIRARISNVQKQRGGKAARFDTEKLTSIVSSRDFRQKLEELLETSSHNEHTESWKSCKDAIHKAATLVLGSPTARGKEDEWYDEECQQATKMKNEARTTMLQNNTRANKQEYRDKRSLERKLLRRKKTHAENEIFKQLENLRERADTRKFYKTLNSTRGDFQAAVTMCKDLQGNIVSGSEKVLKRWREHFDDLLNPTRDLEPVPPQPPEEEAETPPPTLDEVTEAIKQLKNNKAPGLDGITSELIKAGGPSLAIHLHKIITNIWREEELPAEFLDSVLCPIYKKGDKLSCANYRGISLLNTAYKTLANILSKRLDPHMETFVQSYQAGFRRGVSTSDQLFIIRQILQKCNEFGVETHHLFIDFKAAYDTINREELWILMEEFHFPAKLTRLLKATLAGVMCHIRVQGDTAEPFEAKCGLKQGDAISTKLFNIALEGCVRRAMLEVNGTIFTKSTQLLAYADDIDIVGRNVSGVKEAYILLERQATRLGLRVNEDKTKYMVAGRATKSRLGQNITIGENNFEVVTEFIYLGALINAENNTTSEIKRRIVQASRSFYGLRKHLKNRLLTLKTKALIYKTLIRPVLTYASESWSMSRADEDLLSIFERRVLRTIFGPVIEDGLYRRRYNNELYRDYGDTTITHTIKLYRLRWAGHLMRMPDEMPAKKSFISNPGGQRGRGRPKMRWIDGIESDLRALGVENWRTKAMDRRIWKEILGEAKTDNRL